MKTQSPIDAFRPILTRRDLLRATGLATLGLALPAQTQAANAVAQTVAGQPALQPLNRFPRAVQEYYVQRVRELERAALARKAALNSRTQAEAYVQSVRAKIRQCLGTFPPKTPLNARTTARRERAGYHIENIIFESRPNFFVTGNLYVPKNRQFPLAGVLGTCGHFANAKAAETYQSFAQGLAKQGYVVFLFDPIGQGERLQYLTAELKPKMGIGVEEHIHAGNQQILVGEQFAAWRVWDAIRALDYLLARPEVDTRHIGITGNSGGGTIATWLCGVEPRLTMAAPNCFISTARRNLENELAQDMEQYIPQMLALELDQDDFLAAMAPKPVILLAEEKDFFDIRGTEESYERLRRLYRLLGAEENIALHIGPTYHSYSQVNREAMYRWFNRATGVSTATAEPALQIEKDATLQCTPTGQVAALSARTVQSFTAEKAKALRQDKTALSDAALQRALLEVLHIDATPRVPDARILRRVGNRQYPTPEAVCYMVETEPGIHALVTRLTSEAHYSRPPRGQQRAILYVAHRSSDDELRTEPLVRSLRALEPDAAFFACDVRGIGESQPDTCGGAAEFLKPYGSDYFYAGHALMLNEPYVGRKTLDVLRVIEWLKQYGHTDIHLVGKAWGALPATFAAVLSDPVKQVTLKHALTSYSAIAEAETYQWPLSVLLPNVLAHFDLPDCYRVLAARKQLRQIEPWDEQGRVVAPAVTR